MKYALILVGAILGGLFTNAKMTPPAAATNKVEIVYGTRVDGLGQLMLVTK